MKKLLFALVCFFAFQTADAQVIFGLKAGFNSNDITPQDVNIPQNGTDDLVFKLQDANYGLHGGAFLRVPVGGLYIQADALLASSSMNYTLDSLSGTTILEDRKNFVNLNVPIVVGMTFMDILRVNAGLAGNFTLNNQSDLFSSANYASTWDGMTWGYQLGVGVDIKQFTVDASFQGAITQFGNEVTIGGTAYELDNRPRSFVVSVGYKLFGE